MKECPFCREEIRDDPIKCRYCGSSLLPSQTAQEKPIPAAELESNQVLFIVDRGFLYFAKFVVAIVLFVFAVGTAYFGFDINKARESVEQTAKEVRAVQTEIHESQKSVEEQVLKIKDEAQQQLAQVQSTQAKIHKILARSQRESGAIHSKYVELRIGVGDVSNSIEVVARTFKVPEIAALYHFPQGQDGSGQTIALIELDGGYRDADLDAYFAALHVHRPKVSDVSVAVRRNAHVADQHVRKSLVDRFPYITPFRQGLSFRF
jgi:hypothetical protein